MTASAVDYQGSVEEPLNREPSYSHLLSSFITRTEVYDRNHGPIPVIDADAHRILIAGAVEQHLSLSLQDLKQLPQHSVVCALQCAGNRRHTMRTLVKEVSGIDWFDGAVMNCEWTGPRLADVLRKAALHTGKHEWSGVHVEFSCHQNPSTEEKWYGTSVSLEKAMDHDADVIVALKMNGETLTAPHGYPARIIAPGLAGVRSVKWLDRITVQLNESMNHYHQRDYKVLPPDVGDQDAAKGVWPQTPPLQEMPINSAVLQPQDGEQVALSQDNTIVVRGYALPGYRGGPIVSVQVSANDGDSWQEAELYTGLSGEDKAKYDLKWAWCPWQARVKMSRGNGQTLLSRATDQKGNAQTQARSEWNLRGIAYNGYGEVRNVQIV